MTAEDILNKRSLIFYMGSTQGTKVVKCIFTNFQANVLVIQKNCTKCIYRPELNKKNYKK